MYLGLQARLDRLLNRHGDGRAVCVAADHGYMSDVTPNVVNLRPITTAVIQGGVDGILLSPGQAMRLAPFFQGRDGPALILRADWMNMPRLGTSNVANAVPQRLLWHQKVVTAGQALDLGASAITIRSDLARRLDEHAPPGNLQRRQRRTAAIIVAPESCHRRASLGSGRLGHHHPIGSCAPTG